jgi:hypothetical protein
VKAGDSPVFAKCGRVHSFLRVTFCSFMEERRDTPPLVVVEHRHLSLTSPAPKHLHWSSPLRRFNAKYWHVNFQLSRIGRHHSQGPGKRRYRRCGNFKFPITRLIGTYCRRCRSPLLKATLEISEEPLASAGAAPNPPAACPDDILYRLPFLDRNVDDRLM